MLLSEGKLEATSSGSNASGSLSLTHFYYLLFYKGHVKCTYLMKQCGNWEGLNAGQRVTSSLD